MKNVHFYECVECVGMQGLLSFSFFAMAKAKNNSKNDPQTNETTLE